MMSPAKYFLFLLSCFSNSLVAPASSVSSDESDNMSLSSLDDERPPIRRTIIRPQHIISPAMSISKIVIGRKCRKYDKLCKIFHADMDKVKESLLIQAQASVPIREHAQNLFYARHQAQMSFYVIVDFIDNLPPDYKKEVIIAAIEKDIDSQHTDSFCYPKVRYLLTPESRALFLRGIQMSPSPKDLHQIDPHHPVPAKKFRKKKAAKKS